MGPYTADKKEELAVRIGRLTEKEHLVQVYNLVRRNGGVVARTNGTSIVVPFHSLKNSTYRSVEKLVETAEAAERAALKVSECAPAPGLSKKYTPYSKDEFQDGGRHVRYSNKEKILMRRRRYNEEASAAAYDEFNVEALAVSASE